MDNLIEQVVPKARSFKYYLNLTLILLGVIAIPGFTILISLLIDLHYLIVVAFFLFLFCIYGAWYFITSLKVDYEYAFLSPTLRVDKIIAKRRRKKILKISVTQIEDLIPYSDKAMSRTKFRRIYRASGKEFSDENYIAVFREGAKRRCALIFTPNEKLLNGMKPFFSNELKKKLYFSKQR